MNPRMQQHPRTPGVNADAGWRQHGVDMPIVEQVVAVVRDGQPATEVGPKLMSRDLKAEKH